MTPNALEDAAREALAQQDELPAADKPKELAPFSGEWFDANLQGLEQEAQRHYNNWQQALGAINAVRQMRALLTPPPQP